MKVYKVTRPDSHGEQYGCYYTNFDAVEAEFDGLEIGESISVTLCEMTAEEYSALGDFEGW